MRGRLQAALLPHGATLNGGDVVSLAIWGLVGLVVSVRTFRWEPQAART